MVKAVFFDVDGTLLSHETKSVSASTRAAIEKLRSAGILCVVATGRQIEEMEKLPVADIPFDAYITLNGQLILDKNKQVLHGVPIRGRAREYLLEMFHERRAPILLVEQREMTLNFVDERVIRVQEAISSGIPHVGSYGGGELYQICAYLTEADEHLLAPIADECVITRWNLGGMDIIAKGGGKVAGIEWYLASQGIRPEETMAFGDGDNDIEMLKFTGTGVAMGNAWDSVKAVADYITAGVDEDGIALALKHFGVIE